MLATIVPYFLLASVSNKSVWPNGPEFQFHSNVGINLKESHKPNQESGINITNEFTCRPKTDTFLQCQFQHKKLIVYDISTKTGVTKATEDTKTGSNIFLPFPFGIEFDKNGVNKIIMNETLSKHETTRDIAKAMASALNVATDLSAVKLSADPVALGQVHNIVLGKCKGDVVANFQPSSEDSSKDADWNLELSPPLEKLAGRNLNVMKTWSLTDCKVGNKYFWLGKFVEVDNEDGQTKDATVNLGKISDRITVSQGNLDYQSVINMDVTVTKTPTPDKMKLDIREISEIRLFGVLPAVGTWPEIDNAVTIDLNEQK